MNKSIPLSLEEMKRYMQQMNLPEVGLEGQILLKKAKVLCIGAGGLGTPLLLYLAASGVGTLGVVDNDIVDVSNLHRQILYNDNDIGRAKVQCVSDKLSLHQPHIKVVPYHERLTAANAEKIINQYDIVSDCSDNFSTRYLLNDVCYQLNKPLVCASVSQYVGQCMMFLGKQGPCYRCLFNEVSYTNNVLNCEQGGVLNVLPGLLGVIQASETMKWILQRGSLLAGRLLTVDILKMQFREYELPSNPNCSLCSNCCSILNQINGQHHRRRSTTMQEYIILPNELHNLLKNNAELELVDVRTIEKHDAFNIGGKHIPTAELPARYNELDPDKLVVTYCTSGGNSMRALQFLLSVGFKNVKSLDGGMTAWQKDSLASAIS